MEYEELVKTTYKALRLACKWIRENPSGFIPEEDYEQQLAMCAGGMIRDPEGDEYVNYFLAKAFEKE